MDSESDSISEDLKAARENIEEMEHLIWNRVVPLITLLFLVVGIIIGFILCEASGIN